MYVRPRAQAPRRSRTATLLMVAVLTSATVSCGNSTASADRPGCVVLDDLTEKAVGTVQTSLGGRFPGVGDNSTYLHRLFDSAGEQAGTVYGRSHVRMRLSNGHLLSYVEETIELNEGTLESHGFLDVTDALAGKAEFVPAIGTEGSFRDKLGRRHLPPMKAGPDSAAGRGPDAKGGLKSKIEVCPAGLLK